MKKSNKWEGIPKNLIPKVQMILNANLSTLETIKQIRSISYVIFHNGAIAQILGRSNSFVTWKLNNK